MNLKFGIIYNSNFYNEINGWDDPEKENILNHLLSLKYLEATEARKEYFMAKKSTSYTYGSGNGIRTYISKPLTKEIDYIRERLNLRFDSSYDLCFINRYDNQKNWLGWHADDGKEMDPKHPIAVVSFGVEREIWWKLKTYKGEIPLDQRQVLGNGSLFIMPVGFQEVFYHKIPKSDRDCGMRISLTFRKSKES